MKAPSGRTPWESDHVNYPVQQGECRLCHAVSRVKLAWDHQGFLCLDQKVCMKRWREGVQ